MLTHLATVSTLYSACVLTLLALQFYVLLCTIVIEILFEFLSLWYSTVQYSAVVENY